MNTHRQLFLCLMLMLMAWGISAQDTLKVTVDIKNEEAINTKELEFSPTFYEDGIVFISTNTDVLKKKAVDLNQDLMMSILRAKRGEDGQLLTAEPFSKDLTTLNHEGPVCFDRTTETIYFSSNAVINGKDQFAKDKVQHTRLYMSKRVNGTWEKPTPLPFNNNEFDDFHPSISIDGDKLFFASNRPGSLGSTDIYVAYKVGDSWSEPVNLGPGVNTRGREAFPFIHADNTLYFASDGFEDRRGGFDLYYVIPEGSEWTKPVNMGEPFNTGGDDMGLIVDLNKINGYYSTSGMGGAGKDDIFNFHTENGNLDDYLLQNMRVPDRELDLKILVTEKSTGKAMPDASIQVLKYDGNNVIGRDENGNLITVQNQDGEDIISTIPPEKSIDGMSDSKGRFSTQIRPGNYVVIISKKTFQTKQYRLPIVKPGNELTAQLEKSSAYAGKVNWIPTLYNYMTNAPMPGAMMVITDQTSNKQDTMITDANGTVEHYIDPNRKFKIDVFQGGKLVGTTEVNSNGWQPGSTVRQNLSVAPLMPGTKIELPNIYYNFNDATLRPDGKKDLDLVVALMNQHPSLVVELASHTDSRGTHAYNEELSQRRANGVVEYLVTKGIGRNRLTPHGYGESEPRNSCTDGVPCTEQEHARNRRTEIRVLSTLDGGGSMMYVDGQLSGVNRENTEPEKNVNTAPASSNELGTVDPDSYYVVAGVFSQETGAQSRLAELLQLGYGEASIVRFPDSPYFSVCAAHFGSRKEANAIRRKLKRDDKLDAFVKQIQ